MIAAVYFVVGLIGPPGVASLAFFVPEKYHARGQRGTRSDGSRVDIYLPFGFALGAVHNVTARRKFEPLDGC